MDGTKPSGIVGTDPSGMDGTKRKQQSKMLKSPYNEL